MLPLISILNKMNPVYIVPPSHLFLGVRTSWFPLHYTPSSFFLMLLYQNPCMYSSCPISGTLVNLGFWQCDDNAYKL